VRDGLWVVGNDLSNRNCTLALYMLLVDSDMHVKAA
jgi:hypothetical protein